jgi:hypothetical protein
LVSRDMTASGVCASGPGDKAGVRAAGSCGGLEAAAQELQGNRISELGEELDEIIVVPPRRSRNLTHVRSQVLTLAVRTDEHAVVGEPSRRGRWRKAGVRLR